MQKGPGSGIFRHRRVALCSAMSTGHTAVANWYPDPADARLLRYWDGVQWTGYTAPASPTPAVAPQQGPDPVAPASATTTSPPEASPVAPDDRMTAGFPEPPTRSQGGLFGSKKAMEAELVRLRQIVDGFGYAEREALQSEIDRLRLERDTAAEETASSQTELAGLQAQLVQARDEMILQEVGVYDYHHRLEDSVSYKTQLDSIRRRIREMSKRDGGAVVGATNWHVNNSVTQGRKMVREFSKLLLRTYNGEAEQLVNKMKPYKLEAAVDRLNKSRDTVMKLGGSLHIMITEAFHQLRIEELRLTADFLAKKEEEKEAQRAEKERLREEARARKEFEAEKARLRKEQAHYANTLDRIRETGTPEEIGTAEAKLAEIGDAISGVEEREANIRAGYVYVISNFGAFGPGVVKIGLTRRLDPMDRVPGNWATRQSRTASTSTPSCSPRTPSHSRTTSTKPLLTAE
jgi:hypothetical protein